MKIFIKKLFLFLLYTAFIYIIAICLMTLFVSHRLTNNLKYNQNGVGHMNTRIKEIKNYKNIDILFLGSSHAYRGFDVRIFKEYNLTSFNLGSSSQTPIQTKILIDRYLEVLNPKLIVFEVYPNVFGSDGVESAVDLVVNDNISMETMKMVFSLNNIKLYNTTIAALFMNTFSLNKDFKEEKVRDDEVYIDGGFVENPMNIYHDKKVFKKNKWALNNNQLKPFNAVINKLKKRGVNYVLVQAPINSRLYKSYTNNSEVNDFLKTKGKYYNFNDLMRLSDSYDFDDSHHLNKNGVIKFNELLIKIFIKDKVFENAGLNVLFKK